MFEIILRKTLNNCRLRIAKWIQAVWIGIAETRDPGYLQDASDGFFAWFRMTFYKNIGDLKYVNCLLFHLSENKAPN